MLSDEERKAIEQIIKISKEQYLDDVDYNVSFLINLIEKQSKEIEELKEDNKNLEDELKKYIVKMTDEQYRRLVDIVGDETNKKWKDKIKAKIKELEKIIEFEKPTYEDVLKYAIEILQSLLEKE